MEHQIIIETEVEGVEPFADALREVIPAALAAEGVGLPCEIDVLFTDDEGIHQINREQRDVDRATDVLSFPMFEFNPGSLPRRRTPTFWTRAAACCPWGTWCCRWTTSGPRRRSSATVSAGSCATWQSTRCSTCWGTTTWTRVCRKSR